MGSHTANVVKQYDRSAVSVAWRSAVHNTPLNVLYNAVMKLSARVWILIYLLKMH